MNIVSQTTRQQVFTATALCIMLICLHLLSGCSLENTSASEDKSSGTSPVSGNKGGAAHIASAPSPYTLNSFISDPCTIQINYSNSTSSVFGLAPNGTLSYTPPAGTTVVSATIAGVVIAPGQEKSFTTVSNQIAYAWMSASRAGHITITDEENGYMLIWSDVD